MLFYDLFYRRFFSGIAPAEQKTLFNLLPTKLLHKLYYIDSTLVKKVLNISMMSCVQPKNLLPLRGFSLHPTFNVFSGEILKLIFD